MTKKILSIAILLSCCTGIAVAPYYSIRSQSENSARWLVGAGWNNQINLCDMDYNYGNMAAIFEYTRSFKPCDIANCLFGCIGSCCCCNDCCGCNSCCDSNCGSCCVSNCGSCCNDCCGCNSCCNNCCSGDCYQIKVAGSQVENRTNCALLADYFGLPTDFESCLSFQPRIENYLLDLNLYLGLDRWCQGLYISMHAPIVHTRWDLNMCECVSAAGENNHYLGYFNDTVTVIGTETYGIARADLGCNASSFFNGCQPIKNLPTDLTFYPLCHAKMSCCPLKETALADVRMDIGWNRCWCENDLMVGFKVCSAFPSGNRPHAEYLFEPIVGNGKHWELGAGMTGRWITWRSDNDECNWGFYWDLNVTHLFKSKQCRTFDLKCKPLSRYMLAAKYDTPVRNLQEKSSAIATIPSKQFKGIYSPVANISTLSVEVSSNQADFSLMWQGVKGDWSLDLGYNLWYRSCETIEPICCCCDFEDNTWGLKGDAFMYGFYDDEGIIRSVPLSATESAATICKGTNVTAADETYKWYQNPGVDNAAPAVNNDSAALLAFAPSGLGGLIHTSREPVLLRFCDLDIDGAATRALSHKVFFNVDYTCHKDECYSPYVGIGGEVEFGHKKGCCDDDCCGNNSSCYNSCCNDCCGNNNCCTTNCNSCCNDDCCGSETCCCVGSCCCQPCALSQWGVWIKGGVAFN